MRTHSYSRVLIRILYWGAHANLASLLFIATFVYSAYPRALTKIQY